MTSMELLELLGSVRDTYVVEAHQAIKKKPVPLRKALLIAAVIALTLLLVGCAVAYVLRLQDLKVGEYRYTIPTYYDDEGELIHAYDEEGNIITQETMTPVPIISLQGANMEALSEWIAFTDSYDPEGWTRLEAERSGSDREIPEQYSYTYNCYTPEMVDKLDEIAEKYDLTLLSPSVDLQSYETWVLFDALGVDRVFQSDIPVELEYGSSYFYPEGTFDFDFLLSLDAGDWQLEKGHASYRYSRKVYFDPGTRSYDPENSTQWNYTRKDGRTVLLVQDRQWANIYIDLPDAFITVSLQISVLTGGEETPMSKDMLEQIAELLDLTVQPRPADMAEVEGLRVQAAEQYEAERAAAREARYSGDYESYVKSRLLSTPDIGHMKDTMTYTLYDVNGDGVEDLVTQEEIVSVADGKLYSYFDTSTLPLVQVINICQGGVIEVSTPFSDDRLYFQAGEQGATYIVGLDSHDGWHLLPELPSGDPRKWAMEEITGERAKEIIDSYPRVDLPWQLMKRFGQPVVTKSYTDPYAAYIAKQLDRYYDDAKDYTYALIDLDGNGVDELIARDIERQIGTNKPEYILSVHTIIDGEISNMGMLQGFDYVCEGGILEQSGNFSNGPYYGYYKMENETIVEIDSVFQDPGTRYWGRRKGGEAGKTIREEEAREVIESHKRLKLDMKPFTEYPLK